ncbi:MAG: recombination mediator RecR [Bacteroidota bacterium]
MSSSSKWIDEAVEQMGSLPGIGKKTAMRLVLHLLRRSPEELTAFSQSFMDLKSKVQFCKTCNNISDSATCGICSNENRNRSLICVVADIRDVLAIESTNYFNGVYHVLGGLISPMDGVGPGDLEIDTLMARCSGDAVEEVIFAFNATLEGETTAFYISKKLSSFHVKISSIARGVAVGGELEYTDEVTLGRSLEQRIPYGG